MNAASFFKSSISVAFSFSEIAGAGTGTGTGVIGVSGIFGFGAIGTDGVAEGKGG